MERTIFWGKKALNERRNSPHTRQLELLARWSDRISLLLALAMAFIGVVLSKEGVLL